MSFPPARKDAVAFEEEEVAKAKRHLLEARLAVRPFRDKADGLDPMHSAEADISLAVSYAARARQQAWSPIACKGTDLRTCGTSPMFNDADASCRERRPCNYQHNIDRQNSRNKRSTRGLAFGS